MDQGTPRDGLDEALRHGNSVLPNVDIGATYETNEDGRRAVAEFFGRTRRGR